MTDPHPESPRPGLSAPPVGSGRTPPAREALLDDETLERLAELIAARLDDRQASRDGWVNAETVAAHLSVEVGWVYEHADELGGVRLGDGPKPRRRFRLATVDERVAGGSVCSAGRRSQPPEPRVLRRRRRLPGTTVDLLPVRPSRDGLELVHSPGQGLDGPEPLAEHDR